MLTKSQKIIVVFSVVWLLSCLLISANISNSSLNEHFSFVTFFTISFLFSIPILLYWAGIWIWGFGYIFLALSKLRKIGSLFIAFIVFALVSALIGKLEPTVSIIFGTNANTARTAESLIDILAILFAFFIAKKTYKSIVNRKRIGAVSAPTQQQL